MMLYPVILNTSTNPPILRIISPHNHQPLFTIKIANYERFNFLCRTNSSNWFVSSINVTSTGFWYVDDVKNKKIHPIEELEQIYVIEPQF